MRCPELRFSTNSAVEAVRKGIAAYKCFLTTPSFLSTGIFKGCATRPRDSNAKAASAVLNSEAAQPANRGCFGQHALHVF